VGDEVTLREDPEEDGEVAAPWHGTIEEIDDNCEVLWEALGVVWRDGAGSAATPISPWEVTVRHSGHGNAEAAAALLPVPPTLEAADRHRIAAGLRALAATPGFELFVDAVPLDDSITPMYAAMVACPVHVRLLEARVRGQFYRQVEALLHDAETITHNCATYNSEGSPIVETSKTLVQSIRELVLGDGTSVGSKNGHRWVTHGDVEDHDDEEDSEASGSSVPRRKVVAVMRVEEEDEHRGVVARATTLKIRVRRGAQEKSTMGSQSAAAVPLRRVKRLRRGSSVSEGSGSDSDGDGRSRRRTRRSSRSSSAAVQSYAESDDNGDGAGRRAGRDESDESDASDASHNSAGRHNSFSSSGSDDSSESDSSGTPRRSRSTRKRKDVSPPRRGRRRGARGSTAAKAIKGESQSDGMLSDSAEDADIAIIAATADYRIPAQKLLEVLRSILGQFEHADESKYFAEPVTDAVVEGYSEVICDPMAFETMADKIEDEQYTALPAFVVRARRAPLRF